MKRPWCYLRALGADKHTDKMAGVDLPVEVGNVLLAVQSSWYMSLIEATRTHLSCISDLDALKQVRQFLHYFANMSQMRIQ